MFMVMGNYTTNNSCRIAANDISGAGAFRMLFIGV